MKITSLQAALVASLVALGWAANVQGQEQPSERRQIGGAGENGNLRKAPDAPLQEDQASSFDRESWKRALTASQLDEREKSYDELVEVARRDPAARAALEEWSKGTDELAWTSRLALRELPRSPTWSLQPHGFGGDRGDFDLWFDFPFDGAARGGFQLDHRKLLEDLQRRLDELVPHGGGAPIAPPQGGGVQSQSHGRSFQLQSTPDGVKVRVEEQRDGETQTREYEAKDMQELLERYPELREHIGMQGAPAVPNVRKELDDILERLRGFDTPGVPEPRSLAPQPSEVPTDVLGVYCGPASDGEGLLVERIEPGTIAKAIGVQRGDVLLEVNGIELSENADISRALRERVADQELQVKLRDRRGEERTLVWKPVAVRDR